MVVGGVEDNSKFSKMTRMGRRPEGNEWEVVEKMMREVIEEMTNGADVVMVMPKRSEVWRWKCVRDWLRSGDVEEVDMDDDGVVVKVATNVVGVVEVVKAKIKIPKEKKKMRRQRNKVVEVGKDVYDVVMKGWLLQRRLNKESVRVVTVDGEGKLVDTPGRRARCMRRWRMMM